MIICSILITLTLVNAQLNRLNHLVDIDSLTNLCMLGQKHKPTPSSEPKLTGQCEKWKYKSCCYSNISYEIDVSFTAHGFTYNHCPDHYMSEKCMDYFHRDLCFYECSPDLGPWLVKVSGMKSRQERFYQAPLCKSDCLQWWNDCRDEYTCTGNWDKGFVWKKGVNTCPPDSQCRPFYQIYGDAKYFCETIWDKSWRVVDDNEYNCFHVGIDTNNNGALVSLKEATLLLRSIHGVGFILRSMKFILLFVNCFVFYINY